VGVVVSVTNTSSLRQELSGVSEWPKIVRMTATSRPQRRYDHRLRISSTRTRDVTIAPNLGVPWSTARGWLAAEATVVISLDVAEVTESELRQEILKLRQRVEKLAALLRLALALLQTPGSRLSSAPLPDGEAKLRILRAVDRAGTCIPLRVVLRFLHLAPDGTRLFFSRCQATSGRAKRPRNVEVFRDSRVSRALSEHQPTRHFVTRVLPRKRQSEGRRGAPVRRSRSCWHPSESRRREPRISVASGCPRAGWADSTGARMLIAGLPRIFSNQHVAAEEAYVITAAGIGRLGAWRAAEVRPRSDMASI